MNTSFTWTVQFHTNMVTKLNNKFQDIYKDNIVDNDINKTKYTALTLLICLQIYWAIYEFNLFSTYNLKRFEWTLSPCCFNLILFWEVFFLPVNMSDNNKVVVKSRIWSVSLRAYTTPSNTTNTTWKDPVMNVEIFVMNFIQKIVDGNQLPKRYLRKSKDGYNQGTLWSAAITLTHKSSNPATSNQLLLIYLK